MRRVEQTNKQTKEAFWRTANIFLNFVEGSQGGCAPRARGTTACMDRVLVVTRESGSTWGLKVRGHVLPSDLNSPATVIQVIPGSASATAGVQVGDVITAVDGNTLTVKLNDLLLEPAYKHAVTIRLTVTRDSSTRLEMLKAEVERRRKLSPSHEEEEILQKLEEELTTMVSPPRPDDPAELSESESDVDSTVPVKATPSKAPDPSDIAKAARDALQAINAAAVASVTPASPAPEPATPTAQQPDGAAAATPTGSSPGTPLQSLLKASWYKQKIEQGGSFAAKGGSVLVQGGGTIAAKGGNALVQGSSAVGTAAVSAVSNSATAVVNVPWAARNPGEAKAKLSGVLSESKESIKERTRRISESAKGGAVALKDGAIRVGWGLSPGAPRKSIAAQGAAAVESPAAKGPAAEAPAAEGPAAEPPAAEKSEVGASRVSAD